MLRRHNPFSTCYTAPGKIPYNVTGEMGDAESFCAELHQRWLSSKRVGAILGPHGAGKSTLVAALQRHWTARHGYHVAKLTLHNGQRTLPTSFCGKTFVSSSW